MPETNKPRVLVTGATGNTGNALVDLLLNDSIEPVAAITSELRASLLPEGIAWRTCQLDNPASLEHACEGMDYLFICLPFHRNMIERGLNLVSAARSAGVRHIVKVSGWHAAPDSRSGMGRLHGHVDQAIIDSGISYTILRCNSFMENYSGLYASMIRKGRKLVLAEGSASFAFITTADIAAVAAAVLIHPENHLNRVYDLTGTTSHTHEEAMDILSKVLNESIRYKAVPSEAVSDTYRRFGLTEWEIEILESLGNYLREGHASTPTSTVEQILGREPVSLEEFFQSRRRGLAYRSRD